jgi:hypothetical protein
MKFWPKHALISDGPSDVLSESVGNANVDNENFEPEIARKVKKTLCLLSSDPEKWECQATRRK